MGADPTINGGTISTNTGIGVAATGGTTIVDAVGGSYNLAFVSEGGVAVGSKRRCGAAATSASVATAARRLRRRRLAGPRSPKIIPIIINSSKVI
jgi:hypothetical protein